MGLFKRTAWPPTTPERTPDTPPMPVTPPATPTTPVPHHNPAPNQQSYPKPRAWYSKLGFKTPPSTTPPIGQESPHPQRPTYVPDTPPPDLSDTEKSTLLGQSSPTQSSSASSAPSTPDDEVRSFEAHQAARNRVNETRAFLGIPRTDSTSSTAANSRSRGANLDIARLMLLPLTKPNFILPFRPPAQAPMCRICGRAFRTDGHVFPVERVWRIHGENGEVHAVHDACVSKGFSGDLRKREGELGCVRCDAVWKCLAGSSREFPSSRGVGFERLRKERRDDEVGMEYELIDVAGDEVEDDEGVDYGGRITRFFRPKT